MANYGQRLIPENELKYLERVIENIPDPDDIGSGGGGIIYRAGEGIKISQHTISVDPITVAMKTDIPTVPTKLSDLTNDVGYITLSALTGYALLTDIPTSVSQLTNDSGYITNTVNDLTNYTLTSNLASVATSGSYLDLSNTPTIPDAVSGTNDGTNWTTITIGSDTYNIPSGSGGGPDIITIPYDLMGYTIPSAERTKIKVGTYIICTYSNEGLFIISAKDNYKWYLQKLTPNSIAGSGRAYDNPQIEFDDSNPNSYTVYIGWNLYTIDATDYYIAYGQNGFRTPIRFNKQDFIADTFVSNQLNIIPTYRHTISFIAEFSSSVNSRFYITCILDTRLYSTQFSNLAALHSWILSNLQSTDLPITSAIDIDGAKHKLIIYAPMSTGDWLDYYAYDSSTNTYGTTLSSTQFTATNFTDVVRKIE